MPISYSNYPENWNELRAKVLERAGNRCEGSPGHYPDCRAENHKPHPFTHSRVILTVAHLDHDTTHNDMSNLRAMCQRCHNAYDFQHRRANAAKTRLARKLKRLGYTQTDLYQEPPHDED